MKPLLSLVRAGFSILLVLPLVLGVCDQGWSQNGLYCYYFSDVNATQPDAQAMCEQEYATLVYLDDDGENIFCYQNGPFLDGESYWIGYEHIFGDIWRWPSSGKAGSFQKWDLGEPDDEGGCTRMTPYLNGIWRDWDCERKLKFICKKFADCGEPEDMPLASYATVPEPEDPNSNTTVYPLGATVTYTCDEGYEFNDESLSKVAACDIGGFWDPDLPNTDPCEPKQCDSPPVYDENMITNGTDTDREFGTIISYKCDNGYWFNQFELNVTKYIYCAPDKKWRGDTIEECSKVYCIRPVTSHARASTPLNTFGTVAQYECDEGYEFEDNSTMKTFTCDTNGWVPPPQPCIELRCPDLKDDEIPANAWNSTNSTKVFTEVVWTCNDGTRFEDTTTHKKMTCQLDQSWDRKITEPCERKACEGAPPNATSTYTSDYNTAEIYRFEDIVTYTCVSTDEPWYFSDGLQTRTAMCNEDGEWSPRVITDCLGEIVSVPPIGVTHLPDEAEGATTYGTITMIMLGVMMAAIVLFDAFTFGKHIGKLKENLCGHKPDQDQLTDSKGEGNNSGTSGSNV